MLNDQLDHRPRLPSISGCLQGSSLEILLLFTLRSKIDETLFFLAASLGLTPALGLDNSFTGELLLIRGGTAASCIVG